MVIIYDFDGTLTPYGAPHYEILEKCGYDEEKLLKRVGLLMNEKDLSLYDACIQTFEKIIEENNIIMSVDNIILGSDKVEFNPGVLDYFHDLQTKNSGIKHFVVTSGYEDYICNTLISPFLNGIYGTTYEVTDGIYTKVKRLVTDEEKVIIIKDILKDYKDESVIYIGDGLTDKKAFEYVNSIGGNCLYVGSNDDDFNSFNKLKELGIVFEYFNKDFGKDSEIRRYVESKLKEDYCT